MQAHKITCQSPTPSHKLNVSSFSFLEDIGFSLCSDFKPDYVNHSDVSLFLTGGWVVLTVPVSNHRTTDAETNRHAIDGTFSFILSWSQWL